MKQRNSLLMRVAFYVLVAFAPQITGKDKIVTLLLTLVISATFFGMILFSKKANHLQYTINSKMEGESTS